MYHHSCNPSPPLRPGLVLTSQLPHLPIIGVAKDVCKRLPRNIHVGVFSHIRCPGKFHFRHFTVAALNAIEIERGRPMMIWRCHSTCTESFGAHRPERGAARRNVSTTLLCTTTLRSSLSSHWLYALNACHKCSQFHLQLTFLLRSLLLSFQLVPIVTQVQSITRVSHITLWLVIRRFENIDGCAQSLNKIYLQCLHKLELFCILSNAELSYCSS